MSCSEGRQFKVREFHELCELQVDSITSSREVAIFRARKDASSGVGVCFGETGKGQAVTSSPFARRSSFWQLLVFPEEQLVTLCIFGFLQVFSQLRDCLGIYQGQPKISGTKPIRQHCPQEVGIDTQSQAICVDQSSCTTLGARGSGGAFFFRLPKRWP